MECSWPNSENKWQYDEFAYSDILKNAMRPYTFVSMLLNWLFMHDNDSKLTANVVKNWFSKETIAVLELSKQSPDFNTIDFQWLRVGKKI